MKAFIQRHSFYRFNEQPWINLLIIYRDPAVMENLNIWYFKTYLEE